MIASALPQLSTGAYPAAHDYRGAALS